MRADLGTLETVVAPVPVAHRLALAVAPLDGVTQRAARTESLRVVVEPRARAALAAKGWPLATVPATRRGPVFVIVHTDAVPRAFGAALTVRLTDARACYVARRLRVPLWLLADVIGADSRPVSGPYVPALRRLARPWLLPGAAYPCPSGTTALRIRVRRDGDPVRWARVEARDSSGLLVAWGHGDEHGQALLVLDGLTAPTDPAAPVPLAVRVHVPPLQVPDEVLADLRHDPLADLPIEEIARSPLPPDPPVDGDDVSIGLALPDDYLTAAQDEVVHAVVGTVTPQHDIDFS